MQKVDPQSTSRAYAFSMWMQAPMPMVTFFKTLDVEPLRLYAKCSGLKFNMLMCWCIGRAASQVKEFYMLPVRNELYRYDTLAVSTIVLNKNGDISSCDVPFSDSITVFNRDYLRLTHSVVQSCRNHDETDSMVIGTSALPQYEIDGAVGMYSGIFNNPFIIWGRYRKRCSHAELTVSFQFHHTQMDGAHAAGFLDLLQQVISGGEYKVGQ